MNLGQLYDYLNFCANKAQTGGTYTPQDYNLNLPVVNTEYFEERRKKYEVDQRAKDSLRRFMMFYGYDENPYPVQSTGKLTLPNDYLYFSSLRYRYSKIVNGVTQYEYKDIYLSTDAQWGDALKNKLKPVSKKNPIATLRNTFIQVEPKDLQYVEFTYLRKPAVPVFDYYINNTTFQLVYMTGGTIPPASGVTYSGLSTYTNNQSVSVELEWDDIDVINIADLLLRKIGINLRQEDLVQYSQLMKTENKA